MQRPLRRLLDRVTFLVERFFVRGPHYQLLAVMVFIGLLSLAGGVALQLGDSTSGPIDETVWWAFLRLSDPGYLGDDVGLWRRTVSTIMTVLGYVVFLGSLVAIMTQWLTARMRQLEAGVTPVARRGHIVILGWTNRTATIVRDFLHSEGRVRRFLRFHRTRRLHLVILASEVSTRLVQELKDRVGGRWSSRLITLRSGTPLRIDHLERVDVANAAAIVIPAADMGADSAELADTRTIKTLLTLSNAPEWLDSPLPPAVAEIVNPDKTTIAQEAYRGEIEIVDSASFVCRLIAQNMRHPGLFDVYNELLTHDEDNELYLRECTPELVGKSFEEAAGAFSEATPVGVLRRTSEGFTPLLNPPSDTSLRSDDYVVVIANSYDEAAPNQPARAHPALGASEPDRDEPTGTQRRVLLMGWSHKVPVLLRELDSYADENPTVTVVSTVSPKRRRELLRRSGASELQCVVEHVHSDYTSQSDLESVDPASFDSIVLLGSDRLPTGVESDARTVLGLLCLNRTLKGATQRPHVFVELLDAENAALVSSLEAEFLISPLILSHVLSQVALRRELQVVFRELFTAGGAEITHRPSLSLGLTNEVTYRQLWATLRAQGQTLIGLHDEGSDQVHINPPGDSRWSCGPELELVVITTYA